MTHSAFTEASRKYQEHDYAVAETLLLKCLNAKFRESDCLNNLANTYCQSYLFSIHEYLEGVSETHQKHGEYKKAFKLYERAIELQPNHFQAHFNLGVLLSGRVDYERALKHLAKAASLSPEDPIARYHLAKCKEAMIDDEGAIKDYTLSIELDSSKLEPLLARGGSVALF